MIVMGSTRKKAYRHSTAPAARIMLIQKIQNWGFLTQVVFLYRGGPVCSNSDAVSSPFCGPPTRTTALKDILVERGRKRRKTRFFGTGSLSPRKKEVGCKKKELTGWICSRCGWRLKKTWVKERKIEEASELNWEWLKRPGLLGGRFLWEVLIYWTFHFLYVRSTIKFLDKNF